MFCPDVSGMAGSQGERVVVLNPVSGDADHADRVRALADEHGFAVVETSEAGDGRRLARDAAADGAAVVAAAGGDGTMNQVVHGVADADALDDTAVGVVPCGTGNNFAGNVGVTGVEHAFEVMSGDPRRIDLGAATGDGDDEWLFVNSCVAGLTAEASGETPSDLKERVGVLAYVLTSLRLMTEFHGFALDVAGPDGTSLWEGEAMLALVGNGRRFGPERQAQADVEDGLFEVAVVDTMPPAELLEEAAAYRLLGVESDHVTRLQAPELAIDVESDDTVEFSFDGELASFRRLDADVRPRALSVFVGDDYDPHPD